MYHFTVANLVLPHFITILIHSDKKRYQNVFVMLPHRDAKDVMSSLLSWHKRYDFNAAKFLRSKPMKMHVTNVMNYNYFFLTSDALHVVTLTQWI